jgi:hypothetical protein
MVPAALRAGESFRVALHVITANNEVRDIPATITCRDRGGVLDLEMTATLDGQPVRFYSDSEQTLYALKRGESVPGASRIKVKKGRFDPWIPGLVPN